MDSKTRFLMALRHEKVDRVPFNFWMDRRLMAEYEQEIGHRHWRVTHFGADVIETFAALDMPSGELAEHEGSQWLVRAALEDWEKADELVMPDPNESKVYELIEADLKEFPDKAIILDTPTAWGMLAALIRGYERVYMDMYERPEEFRKLCRRITEVQKVVVEKACQMGITALYLMEDLATSQGLSMSPEMMDEFVLGDAKELAAIAHGHGIPVLFHSDGQILELVPILQDRLGVSGVNPLQPNVNDTPAFMEQFGGSVAVYGGLDNCFTIPDSDPSGVRRHVLEQFEILGKPTGGLIFSTHDIPLKTPRANVEMMVRTIREECVYG